MCPNQEEAQQQGFVVSFVEIEVCEDWVGLEKVFHEVSKIDQCRKKRSHAQKSASTYLVRKQTLHHLAEVRQQCRESDRLRNREVDNVIALQNNALLLLLLLGQESGTCGVFENFTDTFVGLC